MSWQLAVGRWPLLMFTPWPPARTGVAHYASMLVPALRKRIDVEVISQRPTVNSQPGPRIYQLGNNPHHEWIYREAMQTPGTIVLHEIVLHHLIVEMTLARGDLDGYVDALRANHGEAGAAWARGRAAGLHSEMGNFLMPASIELARRSRGVIVHNRYAAERLRSFGVTTPIHQVVHPFDAHPEAAARRDEIRARLGYAPNERVIGFFGFVTAAKRPEVIVEAFARARRVEPTLRLLVVGEPAPNVNLDLFRGEGITFTGYMPDEEFPPFVAAVDRLVNLRYPSAGEASGILMRALDAGKPVAVSDYGPFAEFPDECVVKIPFDREIDALVEFFAGEVPDRSAVQRRWIEENATVDAAADGYVRALKQARRESAGVTRSLPLFPRLEATLRNGRIILRNIGDFTLRTRTYGQPAYRVIVNGEWRELPRDLPPGAETEIAAPNARPITLIHALQGVPLVDDQPFAVLP